MNRKTFNSTHIGAASIMLIFLVLSLVSFAALTMVNSRADYILSKKMADRSRTYYKTCHEANAYIAESASHIYSAYAVSSSEDSFKEMMENESFSKSFPLSEIQTLDVEIRPNYPRFNKDPLYNVTSYRVVTHDENIELDESLPVLK